MSEPEPGVFGSLEPEPLEKKQEPEPLGKKVRSRSRSRLKKKSGAGAAKIHIPPLVRYTLPRVYLCSLYPGSPVPSSGYFRSILSLVIRKPVFTI